MYPTRAFHLFTRFSIPVAVFLFLAAVVVLLAAGCGGEDRDISESRESAERERESATRPLSTATAEPEATAEADRPVSRLGESDAKPHGEVISAGEDHTCWVSTGGSVVCWGDDSSGQSTPPAGEFVSVTAGTFHSCGVRTGGSVVCWGDVAWWGKATPTEGEFASVSAGRAHNCGLMTDGTVDCWGQDDFGHEIVVAPPEGEFASVSAGGAHTCGLRHDGTISCWGSDDNGKSTPPEGEFASVSAGDEHSCGVRTDGSLACWGSDDSDRSTPPEGEFASVSAGHVHSCGVRTDGSVACWGNNDDGESMPPEGEFVSVSAGGSHTCGVKTDGSVTCWGWDFYGQATQPGAARASAAEPTLAPTATPEPAPTQTPVMPTPAPTAAPTAATLPPTPTAASQSTPTPAPVMPTPGPTATPAPTAIPAPTPTPAMSPLRKYAAEHAGGPGAIYVGDLNQLVGPGPKDEWGDSLGNVTLSALQDHLWLYESDYYQSLIEKANLTNPTPLQSSGNRISIQHACINWGLMSCELLESYFVTNLLKRTNDQVEFYVASYSEYGLSGSEALELLANGTLSSATVHSGYVGGEFPSIEILNLWGLYPSREQEFQAAQSIIKDIDELMMGATWSSYSRREGVLMNHNWHGDQFLFCKERIDTLDDFEDSGISSHGPALSDWINGMGAQARDQARFSSLELYTALENGTLDCAASWAGYGYGEYWYEVIDYIVGPLPSFSFSSNVVNGGVWRDIPHDLQQIIIEEAAKSELEALRLAAIQNEIGLQRNIDAGMEFIPFSDEMNRRSMEVAINSVVHNWIDRVRGREIVETFNNKVGPIVGLRVQRNGKVVKTN